MAGTAHLKAAMGNSGQKSSCQQELASLRSHASTTLNLVQVTGRYHRLPKRLEDDYVVKPQGLGTGYNGTVYLATSKTNKLKYAVKPFKLHRLSKGQKRELRNELEVFLAMDHPHVARLTDVYEDESQLRLVMECLVGGELFERVQKLNRFSERDAADAMYQILLATNYLHSQGIVHRDIKLENFLYDSEKFDHLKLIDFGFSRYTTNNRKMKLGCGTLAYMAPEILTGTGYTNKCDLWSVGVVVFILLFGYMPFHGKHDDICQAITRGRFYVKREAWKHLSPQAKAFVEALLVVDPDKRLSACQAIAHPWIAERAKSSTEVVVDNSIVDSLRSFAQASQFRRACMSMMAWTLSNEERAQVRAAFVEIDTDHTGTIKLVELKQVLEEKLQVTDEEVRRIFGALDANNNEEVNYSDFLAAMMSSRIALHDHLVLQTFRRFDVDNSGDITAENLREVLGSCCTEEEAEDLIREADISGDRRISFEEFAAYIHGSSEKQQETMAKLIEAQMSSGQTEELEETKGQTSTPPEAKSKNMKPPPSRVCMLL